MFGVYRGLPRGLVAGWPLGEWQQELALGECYHPSRDLQARLRAALEPYPQVRLAVLFGSAARGTEHGHSDADVGLWLDADARDDLDLRVRLEAQLGRAAERTLDLVMLDQAPPLLRFEIARDGKVLLERKAHAWVDFKARAMIDWWDWAPIARRFHRAAAAKLRQKLVD